MSTKAWRVGVVIPLTAALAVSTASFASAAGTARVGAVASTASVAQLVLSDPVNPGLERPVIGDRPEFRPPVFRNNPVFRPPAFRPPVFRPPLFRAPIFQAPVFRRPILVDPFDQFAGCPIVADDDLVLDDLALGCGLIPEDD